MPAELTDSLSPSQRSKDASAGLEAGDRSSHHTKAEQELGLISFTDSHEPANKQVLPADPTLNDTVGIRTVHTSARPVAPSAHTSADNTRAQGEPFAT
jgi:hypothetical protein